MFSEDTSTAAGQNNPGDLVEYKSIASECGTKGSEEVHIEAKPSAGGAGAAAAPPKREIRSRDLAKEPFLDDTEYYQDRKEEFDLLVQLMQENPKPPKAQHQQIDLFKRFRTYWLLAWIIINGGLLFILLSPASVGIKNPDFAAGYLNLLFNVVLGFSAFRFVFSTLYRIQNVWFS
ncbi:hypothetical protein H9P43_004084 [Blastocladiella emersonii ATCC 22665]|nr:hypothetical protein H9P43_004084 [Blastocladiella emersonii ATCC 22665]